MPTFDKNTETVLKYLNEKCGTDYTVLSKQEVVSSMPKHSAIGVDELDSALNFLRQNDYVAITYNDAREFCVALTGKAVAQLEHKNQGIEKTELTRKQALMVFLLSFFGAMLGSAVVAVLFAFLK